MRVASMLPNNMSKLLVITALLAVAYGQELEKALDADIAAINKLNDVRNVYSYFAAQLSPSARINTASIGFTGKHMNCAMT